MRVNRYNFLFMIGLVLTLGLSAALANGDNHRKKPPKGMGTLNVKTTIVNPSASFWVKVEVDGVERTVKGTETEIDLKEGDYTVYVTTSDGGKWKKPISIRRGKKACICLRITPKPDCKVSGTCDCRLDNSCPPVEKEPCPYRFDIEGPETFMKGQPITFRAVNKGSTSLPEYKWRITPTPLGLEGQGTESIRFDTSLTSDETINVELDFNDDMWKYDSGCKEVRLATPIQKPRREPCDEFVFFAPDDYKARLDGCMGRATDPNAKVFVIIYPGLDRTGKRRYTYERLRRITVDYLTWRKFDPSKFDIKRGSDRGAASVAIWVTYPGDDPPIVY